MDKINTKEEIYLKLSDLLFKKGIKDILEIFTKQLNYKYRNVDIPKEIFTEEIKQRIVEIKIIAEHGDFKIFFIHLDLEKLTNTIQREIIKKLETYGYPYTLFVFSNEKNPRTIHFVNVKYEEKKEDREKIIRRMVVEEGSGFRTYSERLSLIEIDDENLTPLEIQAIHNEAFDVDKVTVEFFNRFKKRGGFHGIKIKPIKDIYTIFIKNIKQNIKQKAQISIEIILNSFSSMHLIKTQVIKIFHYQKI